MTCRKQAGPLRLRTGDHHGELNEDVTANLRAFLGVGWNSPSSYAQGGMAVSLYEQRVEESIYLILSTGQG